MLIYRPYGITYTLYRRLDHSIPHKSERHESRLYIVILIVYMQYLHIRSNIDCSRYTIIITNTKQKAQRFTSGSDSSLEYILYTDLQQLYPPINHTIVVNISTKQVTIEKRRVKHNQTGECLHLLTVNRQDFCAFLDLGNFGFLLTFVLFLWANTKESSWKTMSVATARRVEPGKFMMMDENVRWRWWQAFEED